MNRFLFTLIVATIFASCQKDEVTNQRTAEVPVPPSEVKDYIVIFKEQNFAGLNSLVSESNYEASFDVFQHEYNKIFAQAGVKVEQTTQTYITVANGCAVTLKDSEYQKLKTNPNVKGIIKDSVMYLSATSTSVGCAVDGQEIVPCGVQMVGGGSSAYKGKNRAFTLDTGVAFGHPDLKISKNLQFTAFRSLNDNKATDRHGHGTHVAGIIGAIGNNGTGVVGVAPGAEIVPVKVMDDNGAGSISSILAGLDYVKAKAKPGDVVNMSLGASAVAILDNAVYDISMSGIWFTLAAGNNGGDASLVSPARTNGAYVRTIGAMTCDGKYAFFSNYSVNVVDYFAPGVAICSTGLNDSYVSMSGTSMAAPHAAGILLMSAGNAQSCGMVLCDRDNAYYKAMCL